MGTVPSQNTAEQACEGETSMAVPLTVVSRNGQFFVVGGKDQDGSADGVAGYEGRSVAASKGSLTFDGSVLVLEQPHEGGEGLVRSGSLDEIPDDMESALGADDDGSQLPDDDDVLFAGRRPGTGADGHRWRKYGCKHIRNSSDYRNYYKCSIANCTVKKIELVKFNGADRKPTRTVEIRVRSGSPQAHSYPSHVRGQGEHVHTNTDVAKLKLSNQEDFRNLLRGKRSASTSAATDSAAATAPPASGGPVVLVPSDHLLGETAVEPSVQLPAATVLEPTAGAGHLVVVASGDVDPADDGWQWRKYGQKKVKDSPHPRSYYRCTEVDCPARKKVQASDTQRFITYEGQHNHFEPSDRKKKKQLADMQLTLAIQQGLL